MSILTYDSEEEVIRRANDTDLRPGRRRRDQGPEPRSPRDSPAGSGYLLDQCLGRVGRRKCRSAGTSSRASAVKTASATLAQYTQVKSVQVELGDYVSVF
jgi:betaine-aldehyde dehydrogenase